MLRRVLLPLLGACLLVLAGCGDDDAEDTAEEVEDTAADVAEDVADAAEAAWIELRTDFERLVDEAATGDNGAQEELLDRCRDTLEELRSADDPATDRVGDLCDQIRDADDESAWDELRSEFEEIDANR